MERKRLVVTGANGYLASLVRLYNGSRFDIVPVSRADVDYRDPAAVERFFSSLEAGLVFHTAANATTADCEADPEGTGLVNVESAKAIARACGSMGARLIFISTEQTVNGKTEAGPFDETTELESVTVYGCQKAEVDRWLQESDIDFVTLRLSWMMGMAMAHVHPSPNIVVNTLRALRTKTPTKFTVNEVRGMTYAQRLADSFEAITRLDRGAYNFSSANDLCTFDAARYVGRAFGYDDEALEAYIVPDTERYKDRFRDYRLDTAKIQAAGIPMGTFEEDVARILEDFGYGRA